MRLFSMRWDRNHHLQQWHSWFAWRPVRTEDGDWVWLERVQRAYVIPGGNDPWPYWAYRRRV